MSTSPSFETVPLAEVPRTDATLSFDHRPVVLIVDDEKIIADTRAAIFSSWGCAAMAAYGSEEALALARAFSPDLLITDVALAGLNGVDLAVEIQKELPACKVLLVSGLVVSSDLLAHARDVGRNFTLLAKPVRPVEMIVSLAELNFRWPDLPEAEWAHDAGYKEIA
jgi:CheY-like chemotaxis protein